MTMYEDEDLCSYDCIFSDGLSYPMKDVTNDIKARNGMTNGFKARRLSGREHSREVTPDTNLNHLHLPDTLTNGRTDNKVDELCEQLNSVDMCIKDGSNDSKRPSSESNQASKAFEVETVYRKDRDGDSLLHTALILLEPKLAILFINMAPLPSFLSMKNLMWQSPLHLAALTNLPDVARRLIVGGAEVDSRDKAGNTPLHLACREGFLEIVNHLLEPVRYQETKQNRYEIPYQKIPQDFNVRNYDGLTILHLAALNNHLDVIETLIEKEINLNLKEGKSGYTILHLACKTGNMKLVRLLLRCRSCNINARAYDGSTPFDLARDRSHDIVCMTLAAAGARYGGEEYSDSD